MKKLHVVLLFAFAGILFSSFKSNLLPEKSSPSTVTVEIPDDVMAIIKNSCFGCHNSESRNEDAKKDLSFDTLDSLKPFALAGLLENIREEVEKEKMPPTKFLKNYPDKALTKADKKALLNWVKEEEAKLESTQE